MRLTERLKAAMDPRRIFVAPVWGDPKPMTEVGRKVSRTFGEEPIDRPREALLQASLQRFVANGTVANFTELKYVAHGVAVPIGASGLPLIQRQDLFATFLRLVNERRASAKQFRRCYQGLLGGYFGFDVNGAGREPTALDNWQRLRLYLDDRLDGVMHDARQRAVATPWLEVLSEHRNLLREDPCRRYARRLRQGQPEELRAVCAGLGIASTSWVWDEALMAYVRSVVGLDDDRIFKREFEGVLNLVNGGADLRLPQHLAARAAGMTVVRYQRCSDAPEHVVLRDTAVSLIGNPSDDEVAWRAQVGDEPARKMVERWHKRTLIKEFFNLLAHDGGADTRRLEYWLKWEPRITDMWFALGTYATENRAPKFVDLRRRMASRRLVLDDAEDINNAFIMRIGPLLLIEFGVKNNACFVYAASDFRPNLQQLRHSIHDLKQRERRTKLSHAYQWELKFDEELRALLQKTPAYKGDMAYLEPPAPTMVEGARAAVATPEPRRPVTPAIPVPRATPDLHFDTLIENVRVGAKRQGLPIEDNLYKSGAFWVLMPDPAYRPSFANRLRAHGFKHAEGKGYWIKRP